MRGVGKCLLLTSAWLDPRTLKPQMNPPQELFQKLRVEFLLRAPHTIEARGSTWGKHRLDREQVQWHSAVRHMEVAPLEVPALNDSDDYMEVCFEIQMSAERQNSGERTARFRFQRSGNKVFSGDTGD